MYTNLSQMIVHKKGLWSEIVVFQDTAFPCFTKLVAAIHSRYCIYFWTALATMIVQIQYIWQIFLFKLHWNFKGAHAAIHLSGTTIISEATCRDLVFSRVLPFFEISNCNRLCFQRYRVNLPPVAAIHSTNGPFSIIKEQL